MSKQDDDDIVIKSLKHRYFDLLINEDYPKTPKITEECDNIEKAIKILQLGNNKELQ